MVMNQLWRKRIFATVSFVTGGILVFKQFDIAGYDLIPISFLKLEITLGMILGALLWWMTYLIYKGKM